MFTWKIEDNVLNTEIEKYKIRNTYDSQYCFMAEDERTREEKIEFVDSLTDGALTYLICLAKKFDEDKASGKLKVGEWNIVKKNSLLAWLKKNDTRALIEQRFCVGEIYASSISSQYKLTFPVRSIENFNEKRHYDLYDDYAEETFHRVLLDLAKKEKKYFDEHDEYTLLEKEAYKTIDRFGTFGSIISIGSDGLLIYPEAEGAFGKRNRKLTVEELNAIIEKGKKVEALINELSEDPIKF